MKSINNKRKKEKGKSYLVVHEGFEALEGLVNEIVVSLGSKADKKRPSDHAGGAKRSCWRGF